MKSLTARGVEIATVIDVGVQRETPSLIECFPTAGHLLFEPVKEFHGDIAARLPQYSPRDFRLRGFEPRRRGRLKSLQISGAGVTHAHVGEEGEAVRLARLDTVLPVAGFAPPYLLKIDVDSMDATLNALAGTEGIMNDVACIVCEMVAVHFVSLAQRIEAAGFRLWDIVECCYYDDVLYQSDAVFVRSSLIRSNPRLKPFNFDKYDPQKWRMIGG
ncbi:MAG: hypothetical protein R3C42_03085 [Parvularculaceae bacterium]